MNISKPKYKYFKFYNPPESETLYFLRVLPGNTFYEYKCISREGGIEFSWDDDWLRHSSVEVGEDLKHSTTSDAYTMVQEEPSFIEMSDEEVFGELL